MTSRVGIPRALVCYEYYPMWQALFDALGMETVISPPTSRAMVTAGVARMISETCLPVKTCAGHLVSLRDRGVDYVMLPAVKATEPGLFHCSKFLDLPHLMAAVVEDLPPVLEIEIDLTRQHPDLTEALRSLATSLAPNATRVEEALGSAREAHDRHRANLRDARSAGEVEGVYKSSMENRSAAAPGIPSGQPSPRPPSRPARSCTIGIVGHPYLLYDEYINHSLMERLRGLGAEIRVPEMVPGAGAAIAIRSLTGDKYWVYEGEVTGAAGYFLESEDVDGVIALEAFGCGPDSAMMDVVQRGARRLHRPLLTLVLDEHSGEAGILTRIEAFVDMLTRRK